MQLWPKYGTFPHTVDYEHLYSCGRRFYLSKRENVCHAIKCAWVNCTLLVEHGQYVIVSSAKPASLSDALKR